MRKHILYSFILLSLLSCEDTLEQRFSDSVEVNETIVDLNSLNLAANGAYSFLANPGYYNRNFILIPEIMSDNAFINAFDNTGRFLEFDDYIVNSNDSRVEETYNNMSRVIATTSIVINKAKAISFIESEKKKANHYIGEMYALRALTYHNFLLLFAQPYNFTSGASHLGVPIPDFELLGNGANIQKPGRSTTAKVYAQIVEDLLLAINLMHKESILFRFDVFSAKALLARVYLHMQNWEGARDMADDVILNSNKTLLTRNEYINSWTEDFNKESLFVVSNIKTDNSGINSIGHFYLKLKDAFATNDFKNTLSDTDIRKELYPKFGSTNLVTKFPRTAIKDDNIQVLRLSEIYLIKAEAHAHLNEVTEAQQTLDIIIQRADSKPVEATTEIGQILLNKILLERRKELAYEGFRLFDLTRYGITFNKFRQDTYPIEVISPSSKTVLPIPIDEINVNPNIADQQNPGY
ncbi:RagB/SusD family nutrient uptake outer membrane protein [Aquimarina muelleri]|uniref:Membrane protein n=1 Tax=Aquimarina muelleri TaxID=279356 RepID=A0A918JQU6_9FLAO|nr:RagB/SusD family nutrient uptake outer membrane protein [Aquimarina muelleri]MCX2763022.1 RagB/SusD family nutrient uptake outer membrane protein [Aquimarina muelleri]GGX03391.1 membrane protein [Aquimarina muelleri]